MFVEGIQSTKVWCHTGGGKGASCAELWCHNIKEVDCLAAQSAPREAVGRLLRANIWAPIRRPTEVPILGV